MEENKDLIPKADTENVVQSQEVVAESATTDEVSKNNEVVEQKESKTKGDKTKKDKKPMSKKKKITIITACSVLGAIVLGLIIWVLVLFLSPQATTRLGETKVRVDMGDKYYVGTEGQFEYSKIFPNGTDFNLNGNTLTFQQDSKKVTKEVITIDGAVNINTFEELVSNINAGKKVVIQNAKLSAPKLEGKTEDDRAALTMNVKNDVYGNGAVIDVNEIVTTRLATSNGLLGAQSNGKDYKKKDFDGGTTAFSIEGNDKAVIFQDVHVSGNDFVKEEGGDLAGITDEDIAARGVKLFSAYGALLNVHGSKDKKANAKVIHCVFENGHKVVHIEGSAVIDIEGTIIRNAADTALSIRTAANEKSVINSKNNVIESSLTGGIVFYCWEDTINESNAKDSWNELNIEGFLDIYNWKSEDGLVFMPETEGFSDVGNTIASSVIPSTNYDNLKGYDKQGNKYIHFAIIKLKTGGGLAKNDSTVNGYENIGFSTSKDNGMKDGFPIPPIAKSIAVKQVDVWGYYGEDNKDVKPTDTINEAVLSKLYKELREGRK